VGWLSKRWLEPNESVAEAVESDVSVAALRFGIIEPWKVGVEAAAIRIVVNDYIFARGESFGVVVLNGDGVVGGSSPGVKSWQAIRQGSVCLV